MATQGPNGPGTLANDASIGFSSWTNTGNAAASDNSYSTNNVGPTFQTNYLKATNFGFSIPAGATIDGIVVEIERKESGANIARDNRVRIVKGGTIGSTDKASGTEWPTSDAYATYGSSSDLWGATWTASDINASNFGVVLSVLGLGTGTASVDHFRITVYYTPPVTSTATAAGTAAPATAAASCTFAPKCAGSAASTAAHATCAASMAFAASVSQGTAAPIVPHATGAASMAHTPPVCTATAAPVVGHATAAAQASSIHHASAAPIVPHATCAAAMVYSDPVWTGAAPMTVRRATAEAVGQTWRRGAWRFQGLTLHDG
ncbi:MAG: hypothetical protein IAF94_26025 [Pirellulaceae bacterium]|nr:hypothetical protein [Pirellulaceae bacterium]